MFIPEAVTSRGILKISSEKFLLFFILTRKKYCMSTAPEYQILISLTRLRLTFPDAATEKV